MTDKSIWGVLAEVQGIIEQPKLNASVNYGATKFRYADLGELWRVVRAAIAGKGLFVHHTEDGGYIQVVAHLGEQSAMLAQCPANLVGKPQDVGSALTYAKRYSLAMAFGLVAEEDDDGQRGTAQTVTKSKKRTQAPQQGQKPVTRDYGASDGDLKAARAYLANACAVYAAAKGRETKEVAEEVAARPDYIQDDAACYERIATELMEAVA